MNWTESSRPASTRNWNVRWLSALTWLMCVLALTSCGRGTMQIADTPPEVLVLIQPLEPVPAEFRQPCPEHLPAARDDKLPTLLRNHVEQVAPMYRECRDGKAALIDALDARDRREDARIEAARKALERQGRRLSR